MKLLIAGATGSVGKVILSQILLRPEITSIIALSRTPGPLSSPEDGVDTPKLRNIPIEDYGAFPESVRKKFEGADVCIWTVSITPAKDFKEAKRVCQTCAVTGLQSMHEAGLNHRSGSCISAGVQHPYMPEYLSIRGETEALLSLAAESTGDLEVCIAKPGWITAATFSKRSLMAFAARWTIGMPSVSVFEVSATMLDQVVHGFEREFGE